MAYGEAAPCSNMYVERPRPAVGEGHCAVCHAMGVLVPVGSILQLPCPHGSMPPAYPMSTAYSIPCTC